MIRLMVVEARELLRSKILYKLESNYPKAWNMHLTWILVAQFSFTLSQTISPLLCQSSLWKHLSFEGCFHHLSMSDVMLIFRCAAFTYRINLKYHKLHARLLFNAKERHALHPNTHIYYIQILGAINGGNNCEHRLETSRIVCDWLWYYLSGGRESKIFWPINSVN